MKGLLATVVVLAALLVGADRVAVRVAEGAIAGQAERSAVLTGPAEVDVRGFPFLTQAVRGRYDDVRLQAAGTVEGTALERIDARLRGVRLPLSDALSGDVAELPVDAVGGQVLVTYAELSRQAGDRVQVTAAGDRLRVEGSITVLEQRVTAAALSQVSLQDGDVVVRAQEFETGSGVADGLLERVVGDRFDVRVPVQGLPFGLALQDVQVTPQGLVLTAAGGPTVLRP